MLALFVLNKTIYNSNLYFFSKSTRNLSTYSKRSLNCSYQLLQENYILSALSILYKSLLLLHQTSDNLFTIERIDSKSNLTNIAKSSIVNIDIYACFVKRTIILSVALTNNNYLSIYLCSYCQLFRLC